MTNLKIGNFWKKNTPIWAEQIGNFALIIAGFGVTLGGFMTVGIPEIIDLVPAYKTAIAENTLTDIVNVGTKITMYSAVIGGGVKTVSKFFGIPLKDIEH